MPWFTFSFKDFAVAFLSVLFEGVPFLLAGSLISGMVDVFVSPERLARMLPKNPMAGIFVSGLLGLIFPMCECGSVIIIRRFIRKGLPLSSAVTYMLAAPIVSPIVAFSTFVAFRGQSPWEMASLRLILGYIIATGVGLVVQKLPLSKVLQPRMIADLPGRRTGLHFAAAPVEGEPAADAGTRDFAELAKSAGFFQKILYGIQSATADFLDVAFFFVIGVAIASVFNTAIRQDIIYPLSTNPLVAILTLMGLASCLALCSWTDAFIAASFTVFPFAAKLAFMVFGAMFDVKLFWLYSLIFKRRFVVCMAVGLFVATAFLCWRISAVYSP
jgi:uncharacterized membrane protein YraQ (UPF0718 family)